MPLASFLAGSGVRAIVLYPCPVDLRLPVGLKRPPDRVLKIYELYSEKLVETAKGFHLEFTESGLMDLYTELLLYHEIAPGRCTASPIVDPVVLGACGKSPFSGTDRSGAIHGIANR